MKCSRCSGIGKFRQWHRFAQDELGLVVDCPRCCGTGEQLEKQQLIDRDMVNPVATFGDAVAAILSERHYQAKVAEGRGIGVFQEKAVIIPKSVGDYMIMMEAYMDKARAIWVSTAGNEQTLHMIRKIAGIAVKCMEQHGAPER